MFAQLTNLKSVRCYDNFNEVLQGDVRAAKWATFAYNTLDKLPTTEDLFIICLLCRIEAKECCTPS